MNVKWLFATLPFLSAILLSCSSHPFSSDTKGYSVSVVDNWGLLYGSLDESYSSGEIVEVRLAFRSGPRVGLFLDGDFLQPSEVTMDYQSVFFRMPETDVVIFTTLNENIGGWQEGSSCPKGVSCLSLEVTEYQDPSSQDRSLLLGDSLFFFDPEDYGISKEGIQTGDMFYIYYQGTCRVRETYPSVVDTSEMKLLAVGFSRG